MVDPISIAGLGIAVIDDSIRVITFFVKWIKDARHYGDASHEFRVRLLSEVAKLECFGKFLKDRRADGTSRFSKLPLICQQAVSGLLEELEVYIVAYRDLILKYNIEDLRKAYETHISYGIDDGTFQTSSVMAQVGKDKAKETQKKASLGSVTVWGLFRKKKVESLIANIEGWNGKLMSLLLCGVSFSIETQEDIDARKGVGAEQSQNPFDLRLKIGLNLKDLVEKDEKVSDDFFKSSWVIERVVPANLNSPVHKLFDTNDQDAKPKPQKLVFVNFKTFQLPRRMTEPSETFKLKVAHLARLLSYPVAQDKGFRTLQCIGVMRHDISRGNKQIPQYAFIYDFPSRAGNLIHDFKTLAEAIMSKVETRPTLGERFKLARALAETVFHFHSVNWLHKSIRSDNVILFRRSTTLSFTDPYVVGFEFSRAEGDQSTVDNDDTLNNNLYRHPRRQGLPDARFSILHDIYALGTVLLEIGVWRPLSGFDDSFPSMTPDDIKRTLIEHAQARLPHYMGRGYTEAVLGCLDGSIGGFLSEVEQDQSLSIENRAKIQMAFWDGPVRAIERGLAIE